MSDTIKKLSEYVDLNLELPWEELKEQFDKKFTTIEAAAENDELVNQIMGKANSGLRSLITRISNDLGVEGFGKSDIKEMKTTDIVENFGKAVADLKSTYSEQLEDAKTKLSEAQKSGGSKKDIEEWQTKYQQLETKYNDANGLLESVKSEYDGFKSQVEQEKTESFFNQHKEKAFEGLKFNAENEYTIKGFKSDVFSGIKLERDGDNVVVRDAKTDKRVQFPDKAGVYMELPDYIKHKASEAGLLETDPNKGKTVTKTLTQPSAVVPDNGGNGEFANHRPAAAPIFEKK